MIINFKDEATADIFNGVVSKKALKFSRSLWGLVRRKLDMLNAAHDLKDLKIPPGNQLESLKGQYVGFYSIRVNDQYRLIFRWIDHNARDVQLTDYH